MLLPRFRAGYQWESDQPTGADCRRKAVYLLQQGESSQPDATSCLRCLQDEADR